MYILHLIFQELRFQMSVCIPVSIPWALSDFPYFLASQHLWNEVATLCWLLEVPPPRERSQEMHILLFSWDAAQDSDSRFQQLYLPERSFSWEQSTWVISTTCIAFIELILKFYKWQWLLFWLLVLELMSVWLLMLAKWQTFVFLHLSKKQTKQANKNHKN